ncbi:hypothetical protein Fbal_0577 [Ferrimonas balearica DSM 9799]|uniref:Uncharacterized protein n=1 Tax=Ferrimonas balearica (strain DSM 9799 / CCM 4581 / KCTC 23876 / PAT) TaxID=550540 RepID=E1SQH9_FERBD|nr:hypothetical protein [Ferrimonas balearica]ADN74791.1 hypothetical protein Fbal_0577 [Ferrimonas balearica DSM 9799]MBW3140596.1 hypothetical protein [Ferrimonas balearica]MBW3165427.1 hypothetical protein [Ferrimonas balearica]MBY5981362.1 hypothetical protein [Ferrimonas balearica]MBY6107601.1 hypothetical protein [Ferrimonas balearica]
MSTLTLAVLYGYTGLMALVAPYLLLACLCSGRWWMWPVGVGFFVVILTFLPPPVALFSCYFAVGGAGLLLLNRLWQTVRRYQQQRTA